MNEALSFFFSFFFFFLQIVISESRAYDLSDNHYYVLVNGDWSDYSRWSSCFMMPGQKKWIRLRTRACDNPMPKNGGSCRGNSLDMQTCVDGRDGMHKPNFTVRKQRRSPLSFQIIMSDREPTRWQHNRIYPLPPSTPITLCE